MTSTGQFESGIKKLAQQFKPLIELGDVLNNLSSLENHEAELKTAIYRHKQEIESLVAEVATAKDRAAMAGKDAQTLLAAAKAEAETIRLDAKRSAEEAILKAKDEACRIVQDADSAIEEMAHAKSQLADISKQIKEKKAELSSWESKLAQVKEHAKKQFGL